MTTQEEKKKTKKRKKKNAAKRHWQKVNDRLDNNKLNKDSSQLSKSKDKDKNDEKDKHDNKDKDKDKDKDKPRWFYQLDFDIDMSVQEYDRITSQEIEKAYHNLDIEHLSLQHGYFAKNPEMYIIQFERARVPGVVGTTDTVAKVGMPVNQKPTKVFQVNVQTGSRCPVTRKPSFWQYECQTLDRFIRIKRLNHWKQHFKLLTHDDLQ
ncbi:hypothetical protein RFI_16976, partial [Reticulomyxa filosa]